MCLRFSICLTLTCLAALWTADHFSCRFESAESSSASSRPPHSAKLPRLTKRDLVLDFLLFLKKVFSFWNFSEHRRSLRMISRFHFECPFSSSYGENWPVSLLFLYSLRVTRPFTGKVAHMKLQAWKWAFKNLEKWRLERISLLKKLCLPKLWSNML